MIMTLRYCSLSAGAILAFTVLGCARGLIPNTDVDDTPNNRALVEFCENYRAAVEQRDIRKLIGMAHPSYYEDGGSVDATDDLDFAGLRGYLEQQFVKATSIRYEVRYRRISRNEKHNGWNIAYSYSASYRLPSDTEPVWHREVAENQLELIPDGETFKILSGM
jgi:hypothetical protein